MKKVIGIILIITMLMGFASCGKKEAVSAKPTDSKITVSRSTIFDWLDDSVGMWEFAQHFMEDIIIYKTKLGTWTYAEIDQSLPLSDYNWDNLRHAGPISGTEWEYYEDGELKSIKGIDVSKYNTVTDWDEVKKSGVEYVILRCGYRGYSTGTLTEDEKFIEYAQGAYNAGLKLGCYFVTQAITVDEAIEEAEFVIDLINKSRVPFTYPVCLDLEDAASIDARTSILGKDDRTDIIIAFCERIKQSGRKAMLYAAIRWYIDEMDLSRLTDYDKWFAQYFNRPFFPYEFQMWQYTSSGAVKGVKGDVDLNICFKDYSK